jgi:hypothetical protein
VYAITYVHRERMKYITHPINCATLATTEHGGGVGERVNEGQQEAERGQVAMGGLTFTIGTAWG